jgi:hypothetical protein
MCDVVQAPTQENVKPLYAGNRMVVTGEKAIIYETRATSLDGTHYVVLCKHEGKPWELTPILNVGEALEVPAGAEIKLIDEKEWEAN